MKVYLEIEALEDGLLLLNNKWKKGETISCEMDIFNKKQESPSIHLISVGKS